MEIVLEKYVCCHDECIFCHLVSSIAWISCFWLCLELLSTVLHKVETSYDDESDETFRHRTGVSWLPPLFVLFVLMMWFKKMKRRRCSAPSTMQGRALRDSIGVWVLLLVCCGHTVMGVDLPMPLVYVSPAGVDDQQCGSINHPCAVIHNS